MKERKIMWNQKTQYLGRNGLYYCMGFRIVAVQSIGSEISEEHFKERHPNTPRRNIRIYPINSRGLIGSGFMELPANLETIKEFTSAMLELIGKKGEKRGG